METRKATARRAGALYFLFMLLGIYGEFLSPRFMVPAMPLQRPLTSPAPSSATASASWSLSSLRSSSSFSSLCCTGVRPNHFIYVRDDASDSFVYDVAKALDEHRDLFQVQLEPWYYDPSTVAVSRVIPMHLGAIKYYRERGYVK